MPNDKFDMSLLRPIQSQNSGFDASLLKPIENTSGYIPHKEESFLSKLPRNILIGLTHAGRNLHNLPHDLVQGFERGTKGTGELFNQLPGSKFINRNHPKLSEKLPYDPNNYGDVFGQQGSGTFMDRMIQGGVEHAPEITGVAGLVKAGLRKFPISQRGAARQLRQAEKMVKDLEVNNIPINQELIGQAMPFLPKTHATNEMIKAAQSGEYNPSFSLQSQIGHHERSLRKSPLAAERLLAPEARDLKQLILGEMEKGLRAQGHNDIADFLKGGIDDYRKYIHFRDEVKPILKKIGIPVSALAFLGLGIKKGKAIGSSLID